MDLEGLTLEDLMSLFSLLVTLKNEGSHELVTEAPEEADEKE